jgi:hypothetical protein
MAAEELRQDAAAAQPALIPVFEQLGEAVAVWACWEISGELGERAAVARRIADEEADGFALRLRIAGLQDIPTTPEAGLPPVPVQRPARRVEEPRDGLLRAWQPYLADLALAATLLSKDMEIRDTYPHVRGLADRALRALTRQPVDRDHQARMDARDLEADVNNMLKRLRAREERPPDDAGPSWEWRVALERRFLAAHLEYLLYRFCPHVQQLPERTAGLGRVAADLEDYLAANHPDYAGPDMRLPHGMRVHVVWIMEFYGLDLGRGTDREKAEALRQAARRYREEQAGVQDPEMRTDGDSKL